MATVSNDPLLRVRPWIRDDVAYLLPMATFLLFTQAGVLWPALYPATYAIKTFCVLGLLIWLWPAFTRIRWDYWWVGLLLGVAGVIQWIVMQHWLARHFSLFRSDPATVFDPIRRFHSPMALWTFIAIRLVGASLIVPVMEELFWRDFAWRQIIAPNNFKLAKVGEWAWQPFVIVPVIFAGVHGVWGLTAIVWALMIGSLLVASRSLGACIIMHAVTNLLLGLYVLHFREWGFW